MSNLKYLPLTELRKAKARSQQEIARLGSKLSGERVRLEWINRYIKEKDGGNDT